MPATFDRQFSLWLTQHGEERAAAVNVLEFRHPKWNGLGGAVGLFVSDYGEPFTATTEPGYTLGAYEFIAQALGFTIDLAADNFTTEQRVIIRADNANGAVLNQLRTLTLDDLQTEVEVVYRVYLDTKRSAPAIDPVRLFLTEVRGTRLAAELEATADALPNVKAGTRYTIDTYPTMAYL